MRPLLLCAGMDQARLMRVSLAAMTMGITVKEATEQEWGQPLGALCGLDALSPRPPKAQIGAEMMILAFFTEDLMDDLFAALRKNGMEPPRLKAVLTPTNRGWSLGRLYTEIALEDAALRGGGQGK